MKRYPYIALIALLAASLTACNGDGPSAPTTEGGDDLYGMRFVAITCGMGSTSRSTGIYDDNSISDEEGVYPVSRLYLTAYLADEIGKRQFYFTDKELSSVTDAGNVVAWEATQCFWPLQGKMSFLSYWCPGFSRQPKFDEISFADGSTMARMTVDATDLDGKTDFLYLSHPNVSCPQIGTFPLLYEHGLTWITITLKAEVLNSSSLPDYEKTAELISHLRVNKVVIEDCARRGFATVVPGDGVNIIWDTFNKTENISYVRDQVYYVHGTPQSDISKYEWEEFSDSDEAVPEGSLALLSTEKTLGDYTPATDALPSYVYKGLLIVPQNKTAITVDYTINFDNHNINPIHKVERYVLRDNSVSWLPGYHYNYDIIFRNYTDYDRNFEIVPSWEGVIASRENSCFFGDGYLSGTGVNSYFVLESVHEGGSGMGDDMDYPEGPTVF